MEGSPLVVESDDEKERRRKEEAEEARKARSGQSEILGILAVEPSSEESPVSALEKAWAETERPEPETEERPHVAEEAPKPEPPVESAPQEASDNRPEVPEPEPKEEPEEEPRPQIEAEPEPAEAAAPEKPKIEEVAETDAPDETEKPLTAEEEPVETPEAEPVEPKPEPEVEPAGTGGPEDEPESEPDPQPEADMGPKAEKEPEPEEEKKPGIINTLLGRRGKKTEEEPKEEPEEEPTPSETPEGPKFRFNETIDESDEDEPAAEEAEKPKAEKPETETKRDDEQDKAPGYIGQMVLNTEAAAENRPKPAEEAIEASRAAESKMGVESAPRELGGRRIDTISRAELLEISEKIIIDGSNLRQIYETHLIGERGLRRLVAEYMRGHDLHEPLKHEVVEHEIDFERDPAMRDLPADTGAAIPALEGGSGALEEMLKRADVSAMDSGEQEAFFKARARYEASDHRKGYQARRLADAVLVSVIGILVILVILAYLRR